MLFDKLGRLLARRREDGRLRLRDMMRLRHARLPQPLSGIGTEDYERATKRCLACPSKTLCDELLECGNAQGYGLFCPNTHYIERLRHR
jgi:hypothetical protein